MKIKKVVLMGNVKPTWDIEVKDKHCYILENGVLSHNTLSSSIGNGASGGIEPTFAHFYTRNIIRTGRKTKEPLDVYSYEFLLYKSLVDGGEIEVEPNVKQKLDSNSLDALPDYFVVADNVTPKQHVDMQAAAQRYVDSSISKTVNVPTNISFDEFKDLYMYGYDNGLKGMTTFRYNPDTMSNVLVRKEDQANTTYIFTLEDGTHVEARGNEDIEYDGATHNAENLFGAIREGTYGKF